MNEPSENMPEMEAKESAAPSLREQSASGDAGSPEAEDATVIEEPIFGTTRIFTNDYEAALPEHYNIIKMLGRGGMAEVFLAEDKRLNRQVAIKFLNSEFRKDPERMKRFNQEARAASALNHPNILTIHDIGAKNGIQFIISEYIDGETLSSRIRRGRIALAEAVRLAIQMASALAASHSAGIVHRDIKPDNIMIRRDGSIKVLDFGLAKDTGKNAKASPNFDAATLGREMTSPGLILGTPQYMSPEQARGLQLDVRTDIFSLGIIIFEMAAGSPPFTGSTMADIIAAILTKEPRRIEEFLQDPPLRLISIVDKALRKERDERYLKIENLLADLRALQQELEAEPYIDRRTGPTEVRTTLQHTIRTVLTQKIFRSKWRYVAPALVVLILAAWWNWGAWKSTKLSDPGSMKTIGITSWSSGGSEFITTASFSPNGKMVAYTSSQTGANEIWVKPAVGGDPIQITKSGFYNQYPVWSPNGEEVAFFSSRGENRGIWKTAFTGGEQSQIVRGIGPTSRPIHWAGNGNIYYQDGSKLYSISDGAAEPVQISEFAAQNIRPRMIEISPDESTLVYSIKDNDGWKVKTQPLGTVDAVEIASVKDQVDHLAWHPDGKDVFFSSSVEGVYQIFQAGPSRTSPVQLSNGNIDFFVQDVSPDGSRILYGSVTETSDLWMVDTQDSKESVISNDIASEYWADISPDGKSVVLQSVKQVDRPYSGSIAVTPVSGSGKPSIVASAGFAPVWSPNGRWIACFRQSDSGFAVWRIEPASGEASKLAEGEILTPGYTASPYLMIGTSHLSWSPDSSMIAYSARTDGFSNISIVSADGTQNRSLTANTDANETYGPPIWASDGTFIIFSSEVRTGNPTPKTLRRIWVYEVDISKQRLLFESRERIRLLGLTSDSGKMVFVERGAAPANLTKDKETSTVFVQSLATGAKSRVIELEDAYLHNIHLSRDGRNIAFVSRRDNTAALWIVLVEGGEPKGILIENDPKVMISSLAWSPDGRSIVFGRQTRTNLLSMLTR